MVESTIYIRNKTGLHLRPATELSQMCAQMSSEIKFLFGDKVINPKSVLMLIGAGIKQGSKIVIQVEGENEVEDLKKIEEAIEGGFGEEMIALEDIQKDE
ncbi:MAG: HPr family phosphocarrier protein [Clostridiaceae bacterium]|jgi:phosphocarrier protein|nr:HPr family phosphocarrier protein [Bacillota bacterium]NLN52053.1 HPr family phosphocarrier protein [Clostridiaceae bacterium]